MIQLQFEDSTYVKYIREGPIRLERWYDDIYRMEISSTDNVSEVCGGSETKRKKDIEMDRQLICAEIKVRSNDGRLLYASR